MWVGVFSRFDREFELDHIRITEMQNENLPGGLYKRSWILHLYSHN